MCRAAKARELLRPLISAAAVLVALRPARLASPAMLALAAWQVHPPALAEMLVVARSVPRE
jgi:hypothetical protein